MSLPEGYVFPDAWDDFYDERLNGHDEFIEELNHERSLADDLFCALTAAERLAYGANNVEEIVREIEQARSTWAEVRGVDLATCNWD